MPRPSPRPVQRPPWLERLIVWAGASSGRRLARARAERLRAVTDDVRGAVMWLDCARGSSAARLLRLQTAASASVDVVVSAGSLASAADVAALLAEIKRVLKPGGRLLFAEAVVAGAGTRLRWLQSVIFARAVRLWSIVSGGGEAPRDLWNDLKVARYSALDFARVNLPGLGGIPIPHIVGEATVPAATPLADASGKSAPRAASSSLGVARIPSREPAFVFFGN